METRHSPSISRLYALAQEASIPNYMARSKSEIFDEIRNKCNLQRLQRVVSRKVDYTTDRNSSCERAQQRRRKRKASTGSSSSSSSSSNEGDDEEHIVSKKARKHKKKATTATRVAKATAAPPQKETLNTTDPIMLTPILSKNVFKFHRPNGTTVQFNVESLIDFMLASHDFLEPETRLAFSDQDLAAIDAMVRTVYAQSIHDELY